MPALSSSADAARSPATALTFFLGVDGLGGDDAAQHGIALFYRPGAGDIRHAEFGGFAGEYLDDPLPRVEAALNGGALDSVADLDAEIEGAGGMVGHVTVALYHRNPPCLRR